MKLPDPKSLIHPKQPTFVYDIKKAWEKVVQEGPVWLSGKFPPLLKEKKYSFLGQKLISPIAISAGPASRKIWTDFYLKMGYGLVFEKTRRGIARVSNKAPNVSIVKSQSYLTRENLEIPLKGSLNPKDFENYKSITNSFGNPSPAISVWSQELKEQVKSVADGQLLGCSVTATFPQDGPHCFIVLTKTHRSAAIVETALDLLTSASAAIASGVNVLEFNLACPNVMENTKEGEMFQSARLVRYLFEEFKRRFPNTPAGFKFGLYKNKAQMEKVFLAGGENLDFVSGINAVAVPVEDENGKAMLPGRRNSGVCGKILQKIALEHIRWANQIRKKHGLKYEILGGGGIVEVPDVDKFLNAGADIVQVATIAMVDPLFAYKYHLAHN